MKGFSASAELAVCCVVLLLVVALSAPLWLGFFGTVEAGSNFSSPGRATGQTPRTPTPTIVSEGWQLHNADSWHTDGYKGEGVKIGIIDHGFVGYNSVGRELPTPAHVRCYVAGSVSFTSNLADCRTNSSHGTKVAEVIADIAPEAELYIANTAKYTTPDRMKSTVADMVANGVKVINFSVGGYANAPGDGTSGRAASENHILDVIDYAVEQGIVWVNAGGNDAPYVYYGRLNTAREELSWHRFSGSDFRNSFHLQAGTVVSVTLRWEDQWPRARCNLNVYLYDSASDRSKASGNSSQSGLPTHTPYEGIAWSVVASGDYHVRVLRGRCLNANAPDWIQLLVRGKTTGGNWTNLQYTSADHHILPPAESGKDGMLAVAAAPHSTPTAIKSYSSRGPTVRGSIKPDITGATDVSTRTDRSFGGTSAAAPHVAGMAALVLNRFDGNDNYNSPDEITDYLERNALARGAAGKDKIWGSGFAYLPDVAAEAEFSSWKPSTTKTITQGQSQTFTLETNLADTPGVEISVNQTVAGGSLSLNDKCGSSLERLTTRGDGDSVTLRGCVAGQVTVVLSHNGKTGSGRVIESYTVQVNSAPPPTDLRLGKVSGSTNQLRLTYKDSQRPHYYQFQLERRDLSATGVQWDEVSTTPDSGTPKTFSRVARGYQYRVKGRLCADYSRSTCGPWSSYSGVVEFSDPQIAISGLASSLNSGGNDGFSVSLSDLTRDQPYTVTLSSNSAGIGFDASCKQSDSRAFTPTSVNRNGTLTFTLYACSGSGGTVTAQVRKGSASGAVEDTATAAVRVRETASLSGLGISSGTLSPGFAKGTTGYTARVANSVRSVTVTPTAALSGATIQVNGNVVSSGSGRVVLLNVGSNAITIGVTKPGATSRSYTLTVTRAAPEIAGISGLTISSATLSPGFAGGTTLYRSQVANSVNSVTVTPTAALSGAAIQVNGNVVSSGSGQAVSLNVGINAISIGVTKPGATSRIYTVVVTRAAAATVPFTLTGAETANLSPTPSPFVVGNDQTFTVNANNVLGGKVWVGVNYAGDTGRVALNGLANKGCPHDSGSGRILTNGDTVTIRGCKAGTATIRIYRNSIVLASYQVTVSEATAILFPEPAAFIIGNDQTFTVDTDVAASSTVWVGVNYTGDVGRVALNGLANKGCPHTSESGRQFSNGNTVTIRGCKAGAATIRIYRGSVVLKSYQVTVSEATASLYPAPSPFIVGNDQTFIVDTDVAAPLTVWVGVNYSGDVGRVALNGLANKGCPHTSESGRQFTNDSTVTIRGCKAGTATIRIYRSSVVLATYTVTVNEATASLSPAPASFIVGNDQTFTVNTDVAAPSTVWVGVNYSGDVGRVAVNGLANNGCPHTSESGRQFTNDSTVTIRGCKAGTATIRIYRSSVMLASYQVTVNAATASLSPTPAAFTSGSNQTFTVSTNVADTPGVWVGVNYAGNAGRLGVNGCPNRVNDGRIRTNGDNVTIRGCKAGAVTIRIYLNNTNTVLTSYTVTVR